LLHEEAVYAYRFAGTRYDCGSKLGYLQATVAYALAHPALGGDFRAHLRKVVAAGSRQGRPRQK
jgi:UTP--glucose-1-phosphate uridylyltransferase